MSYAKRNDEYKKRKIKASEEIHGNTYSMMRHDVLSSEQYKKLPMRARALLCDLLGFYNRKNNGDISIPISKMKEWGWTKDTLRKAIDDLIEAQFLIITRQGGYHNKPNLYAFTFYPINDCLDKNGRKKIDVKPTDKAPDYWKHNTLINQFLGAKKSTLEAL